MKCARCDYSIGPVIKGYCELCRNDYGAQLTLFAQREEKAEFSMPDGTSLDGFHIVTDSYFNIERQEPARCGYPWRRCKCKKRKKNKRSTPQH